jgi:hypothetical protein
MTYIISDGEGDSRVDTIFHTVEDLIDEGGLVLVVWPDLSMNTFKKDA